MREETPNKRGPYAFRQDTSSAVPQRRKLRAASAAEVVPQKSVAPLISKSRTPL